jgi:hypothetical protein
MPRTLTLYRRWLSVRTFRGAIAQLGERLHGMQEVGGSIPPSSTKFWSPRPHRLEA